VRRKEGRSETETTKVREEGTVEGSILEEAHSNGTHARSTTAVRSEFVVIAILLLLLFLV
jgi:hypothetical protein